MNHFGQDFNKQQINLYLPEFRKRKELFSLTMSLALLLLVICIMISISVVRNISYRSLSDQVIQLETKQAILAKEVQDIERKENLINGPVLQTLIDEAQVALQNRKNIVRVIQGQALGAGKGFHQGLQVLQQYTSSKLALSDFAFIDGGKGLSITGRAASAKSVPIFVQKLQSAPYYADTLFGALTLQRSGEYVQFNLTAEKLPTNVSTVRGIQ